jgi:Fibronectin type III domain
MVKSLFATLGDETGEIELQWDSVNKAKCYIIQMRMSKTKNPLWKHIDIINDSKYTITGLTPFKSYEFRVAAIGEKGQGDWSEAIIKKAK